MADAGLADRITVLGLDWRDLTGTFDKLVSVEMVEAVDWRWHDQFLAKCADLLTDDGLAAIQAIVIDDRSFERAKRHQDFVRRMVFPGGCLPSVASLTASVARATDLRIVDLEDIGRHYAETLRRWADNLAAHTDAVAALGVGREFRRLWDLYLAYCEAVVPRTPHQRRPARPGQAGPSRPIGRAARMMTPASAGERFDGGLELRRLRCHRRSEPDLAPAQRAAASSSMARTKSSPLRPVKPSAPRRSAWSALMMAAPPSSTVVPGSVGAQMGDDPAGRGGRVLGGARHGDGQQVGHAGQSLGQRVGRRAGTELDHVEAGPPQQVRGDGHRGCVLLARRGGDDDAAAFGPPAAESGADTGDEPHRHRAGPVLVGHGELADVPAVPDGFEGRGHQLEEHLGRGAVRGQGGLEHTPRAGFVAGQQPGLELGFGGGELERPGYGRCGETAGFIWAKSSRVDTPSAPHAGGRELAGADVAVDGHVVHAQLVRGLQQRQRFVRHLCSFVSRS